jgi:hypothetical protein
MRWRLLPIRPFGDLARGGFFFFKGVEGFVRFLLALDGFEHLDVLLGFGRHTLVALGFDLQGTGAQFGGFALLGAGQARAQLVEERFAFVEFFGGLGLFKAGEVQAPWTGLARQGRQELVVDGLHFLGLRLGVQHELLPHDAHRAALLVEEFRYPVHIPRVLVDVEEPVVGRAHVVVTRALQFGDLGIDDLGVEPHGLHRAQQIGLEPGLDVLAHHRQAVKGLGNHPLGQYGRFGDEGQARGHRFQEGQDGFAVGGDLLQLVAEAAGLTLRQDHLLGEVGQHRDDGGADLALHAFEDRRQAGQGCR